MDINNSQKPAFPQEVFMDHKGLSKFEIFSLFAMHAIASDQKALLELRQIARKEKRSVESVISTNSILLSNAMLRVLRGD